MGILKTQQTEYVKVEFIDGEWMGNKPPAKMTLMKQKALDLENRGIVRILDSKIENKSVDEPVVDKMVNSAPINKMIESPDIKKSVGRGRKKIRDSQ